MEVVCVWCRSSWNKICSVSEKLISSEKRFGLRISRLGGGV